MENTLFFPLNTPYDIAYRKDSPNEPVGPHAHNGAEIYITLTALPDVLLGNQVFAVPAGTMIVIPPFCVHQLYHETNVVYERYVINIQDTWLRNAFFDLSQMLPCLLPNSAPLLIGFSKRRDINFKKKLINRFVCLQHNTSN